MELYFEKAGFLYFNRTEFPGFIVVTIESGVLAGVAFTVLFILAIVKSFRAAIHTKPGGDEVSLYIFMSLIGYAICISFNGVFQSLYVFFLLLGILTVKMNSTKIAPSLEQGK
jgi:hypothetical protein